MIIADGFIVNSCKLSYGNNNLNHILLGNHAIKTEIFNTAKIFQIWTKLISLKAHFKDSKVCEFIRLTQEYVLYYTFWPNHMTLRII